MKNAFLQESNPQHTNLTQSCCKAKSVVHYRSSTAFLAVKLLLMEERLLPKETMHDRVDTPGTQCKYVYTMLLRNIDGDLIYKTFTEIKLQDQTDKAPTNRLMSPCLLLLLLMLRNAAMKASSVIIDFKIISSYGTNMLDMRI